MRTRNRRRGFTLVELLVATTLTIFIMLILTSAFRAGLDAFRLIRATGQMQEKLRAATAILRRDLTAEHFGPASDSFNGPYLRDQRLDVVGWTPPTQGFFRIQQNAESGTLPFTSEKQDSDSIPTNRSTGHILHFTARLSQAKQSDYFSGSYSDPTTTTGLTLLREPFGIPGYTVANSVFASEWAEVAYFLVPVGGRSTTGPSPVPTFALCRKQRLATQPGTTGTQAPRVNPLLSPEISYQSTTDGNYFTNPAGNPTGNAVNSIEDLTQPNNRMDANTTLPTIAGVYPAGAYLGTGTTGSRPRALSEIPTLGSFAGNDILLTNVVSFEVKAIWTSMANVHAKPSSPEEDNDSPFFYLPSNKLNTSASLPAGTRLFDTWSQAISPSGIDWTSRTSGNPNTLTQLPQQVPQRIRIQQLQIRLRIWDTKAEQTRQITIVQDV